VYPLAFEHARDPTVLLDESGLVLRMNRAARALPDEVVERLLRDPTCAPELEPFRDALVAQTHTHGEVDVCRRVFAFDVRAIGPLRVLVLHDQSALREFEARLRTLERVESAGHVAAGLAHDFNNLLTPIACLSACLEAALPVGSTAREMAHDIRVAGERAAGLASQTLRRARRDPTPVEAVDVNAVVDELRTLVERVAGGDIRVDICLGKDAGAGRIDRERLEHALLNLAANARDAMPAGGRLTVTTAKVCFDPTGAGASEGAVPGAYVSVCVGDSGMGMTREVRERIFQTFFTTKPAGRGTGLGLAAVRRFVAESAGCMAVHSEARRGTTVVLYFPWVEPSALAPGARAPEDSSRGGSETLLLVDDDLHVRRASRAVLETYGYRVIDAASGGEALARAQALEDPVDLVIADVMMPGINGPELVRRLRLLRPVRALFISGHTERRLEGQGLEPDDPILRKAFTPSDLLRRVRETLDRYEPAGASAHRLRAIR